MKNKIGNLVLAAVAASLLVSACSPREPAKHAPAGEPGKESQNSAQPLSEVAVRDIYLRSCHSCHGSGVSGAPRAGDSAAWAPRLAKGMDALVASATNGYRAMPPRGLCFDCSEAEYAALIRMMADTVPEAD